MHVAHLAFLLATCSLGTDYLANEVSDPSPMRLA